MGTITFCALMGCIIAVSMWGIFLGFKTLVICIADMRTNRRKKKALKDAYIFIKSVKEITTRQNDFEVPLIHSTKHNTTIYAYKADA